MDSLKKGGRTVITRAAQVYGRNSLKKTTKIGRFGNASCTLLQIRSRFGESLPTKACRNRASAVQRPFSQTERGMG